jgi:hypothetical protein
MKNKVIDALCFIADIVSDYTFLAGKSYRWKAIKKSLSYRFFKKRII